jgi:hypothetical protein
MIMVYGHKFYFYIPFFRSAQTPISPKHPTLNKPERFNDVAFTYTSSVLI